MRFMNTYEIDEKQSRHASHPVLGPATKTLASLRDAADANSDGWCYWPKPARAAEKLMDLIERSDATPADLVAAYRPLKSFRTRSGLKFDIFEAGK